MRREASRKAESLHCSKTSRRNSSSTAPGGRPPGWLHWDLVALSQMLGPPFSFGQFSGLDSKFLQAELQTTMLRRSCAPRLRPATLSLLSCLVCPLPTGSSNGVGKRFQHVMVLTLFCMPAYRKTPCSRSNPSLGTSRSLSIARTLCVGGSACGKEADRALTRGAFSGQNCC